MTDLPHGDALTIGTCIGAYRILDELGRGGMGVVYKGLHQELQRSVAIKMMLPFVADDEQLVERFMREGRLAATVDHPNVVTIFDCGRSQGCPYLVLEFVDGGDLQQFYQKRGPLPEEQALRMIVQAAKGLQALEAKGLVHRDIKPCNIFLSSEGVIKLGDMGLAREQHDTDGLTATGHGIGTPTYMPPEQILGQKDIDSRADIYALGATLYTLLSGQRPFEGSSPFAVMQAVLNEDPPALHEIRPDLQEATYALVRTAMAKDRDQRHDNASAFLAAARAAMPEPITQPLPQDHPSTGPAVKPAARSLPTTWIAAGIGAAAFLLLLAITWGGGQPANPETATANANALQPATTGMASAPQTPPAPAEPAALPAAAPATPEQAAITSTTAPPVIASADPVDQPPVADSAAAQPTAAEAPIARQNPRPRVTNPSWSVRHGRDRYGNWAVMSVQGIEQRMRWIPAGQFTMGSTDAERRAVTSNEADADALANETRRPVTLSTGFWIADTECTQAFWQAVMGEQPSHFTGDLQRPVDTVSWADCRRFVQALNGTIDGLTDARLPTEAEWEYACRAGTDTMTPAGDFTLIARNNAPDLGQLAWYLGNSGHDWQGEHGIDTSQSSDKELPSKVAGSWPVALKPANPWGLHDMLGNLAEWVDDGYIEYDSQAAVDPVGPANSPWRANRGGSWLSSPANCRAARRVRQNPSRGFYHLGFRILIPE